ncbi:hypothetical protein NDR89_23050 [Cupriavidus gilardii]|uniref:Uncharacterized protein n=1 Tax=Cupriavidus gilardii TaxID=82541 RepID=A0ABY4VQF2_9BURK|nr:hypothetical protein [Cupriavidus gilardii]USE79471.1 hypothetical protein NDR89_23050 [Cupriavidus gilardii]
MTMFNPTAVLVAIGVTLALSTGAYVKGRSDGAEKERIAQQKEIDKWRTKADKAAADLETAREAKRPKYAEADRKIEKATNENPVYRDCRADDDSMRALRDKINAANSGKPAAGVPADPPAGE